MTGGAGRPIRALHVGRAAATRPDRREHPMPKRAVKVGRGRAKQISAAAAAIALAVAAVSHAAPPPVVLTVNPSQAPGNGNFLTIQSAIDSIPATNIQRYT